MKDYLLSIITLVAGGLVGMVATYISAKQKFRDDLQSKFNEGLHNTRVETYQQLWRRLEVLAKYARPEPVTPVRLRTLSEELRQWYYHVGGLFLTESSRDAYFAVQDAIVNELAVNKSPDKELSDPAYEVIRKKGSRLRTSLSADLPSRKQPEI